jgi:hypothetical protein
MITITLSKPVRMNKLIEQFSAAGFKSFTYTDTKIIVQDSDDQAAVMAVYNAHDASIYDAEDAQVITAKNAIIATAQTAVGVPLTALTQAQIKALMACLLYAAGGVDPKTLTVKPLNEWMK